MHLIKILLEEISNYSNCTMELYSSRGGGSLWKMAPILSSMLTNLLRAKLGPPGAARLSRLLLGHLVLAQRCSRPTYKSNGRHAINRQTVESRFKVPEIASKPSASRIHRITCKLSP